MKFIIFLLIFFLLFSCSMVTPDKEWFQLNTVPKELNKDTSNKNIARWINNHLNHLNYINGFHQAQKTLDERKGNCANFSLLVLAMIYKVKGIKGQLIYCLANDGLHYTPAIDGISLEPEWRIKQVYETIEFDNIADYIFYRQ